MTGTELHFRFRGKGGIEVTAKDYRTWIGTLLAFHELRAGSEPGAGALPRGPNGP